MGVFRVCLCSEEQAVSRQGNSCTSSWSSGAINNRYAVHRRLPVFEMSRITAKAAPRPVRRCACESLCHCSTLDLVSIERFACTGRREGSGASSFRTDQAGTTQGHCIRIAACQLSHAHQRTGSDAERGAGTGQHSSRSAAANTPDTSAADASRLDARPQVLAPVHVPVARAAVRPQLQAARAQSEAHHARAAQQRSRAPILQQVTVVPSALSLYRCAEISLCAASLELRT